MIEMIKRDVPGFAIGGLSGGESHEDLWKMVTLTTDILPKYKPRYLMGVGFGFLLNNMYLFCRYVTSSRIYL